MKKLLKMLTLLLLIIVPTVLVACNNTYQSIEIVASSLGDEQTISMFVDEKKEITFNVYKLPKNASGRLSFTKNSSSISDIDVIRYNKGNNNENVISFKANSYGRAEIRAIAEGGKYITIVVNIQEKITDFSLKEELVLVRGDTSRSVINLSSDLFNFTPKETQQKTLEFTNIQNEIITSVNIEDYQNQDEVIVRARSPFLEQTKDFIIKIVNKIEPFEFYIVNKEQGNPEQENQRIISHEEKTDQSQKSIIYLSANKKQEFSFKNLQAIIEGENTLYDVDIKSNTSGKVLVTYDSTKRELIDGNTAFNFVISVGGFDWGEQDIVFEAYYTNINQEVYKVTRTFTVVIVEYPNKVFVNNTDAQELEPIILHIGHHQELTTNVKVDIYPTNAKFDRIEISYNTSNLGGQQDIADYIEFKQNGNPLTTITNFSAPIVAKGIKNTEDKTVWLNLKIIYGNEFKQEDFYEEISIPFKVKAGANQLHMEEQWEDGVLYVSLNYGPITFKNGLYVEELAAYLEDVEVRALTSQSSQIARVVPEQEIPTEDKKFLPIKIYPLSAGQARFNIVLANGVSRQIRVVVVPEISSFNVDYDKNESSTVTLAKYDNNKNIYELNMQLEKQLGENYFIKTKFTFKTDILNYLSQYPQYYNVTYEKQNNVNFDETLRVLTLENIPSVGIINQELIVFKLNLFKIENFKLLNSAELPQDQRQGYEFTYSIRYNAFLPLTSISFSETQLALFSQSDLGIYYTTEASKETKLNFHPQEVAQSFANIVPNVGTNPNIKLDYYVENTASRLEGSHLIIGQPNAEYGVYNIETGAFTLDYKASNVAPFDVFARATYYEKVYIARFTVTPKEYIMPSSIQFSDYIDGIYLDATRPRAEINMYILPRNATHKVIEYDFEAPPGFNSNALSIEIRDNSKLIVTYNTNVDVKEYGYIILKPRASVTSTSTTPSNSRRIRVDIGTGSYTNPYKIYTAEQLLNISVMGLDNHYQIMNRIDLSHITNLKPIGKLTGSIRGGDGVSEISGININSQNGENNGLFTSIATKPDDIYSGLIQNISFSGSLNLTLNSASNVGLIAGRLEAGARLENTTVTLLSSTVTVSTQEIVNIGGIIGYNEGIIKNIIKEDTKQYASLLVGSLMKINYTQNSYIANNRSFVGGVVGVNAEKALITRVVAEENVSLYNAGNHFATQNILITGLYPSELNFAVGLVAGKNLAIIKAEKNIDGQVQNLDNTGFSDYIKLAGQIRVENQSNNIVGGIVGENLQSAQNPALLEGIASRVKLVSYGSGTSTGAFFGGMFGSNSADINNLVLQAVEDGASIGIEASMIYSNEFGISPLTSGRIGVYGYDVITGRQISQTEAQNFNLLTQTYIGAEDDNQVPSSRRQFIQRPQPGNNSVADLTKYYGDFVIGSTPYTDNVAEEERTAIKFTPANASFLVDENNIKNRLISETQPNILMAYLKLYKAKDIEDQSIIENLGYNKKQIPFGTVGEVSLISLNTDVLSILNDGTLKLNKTGLVSIQIYSLLNKKVLRTVYVMVTNAFDSYDLHYRGLDFESSIKGSNNVKVTTQSAVSLVPVISANSLDLNGFNVDVESSSDIIFENVQEQTPLTTVIFEKVGGTYILKAVNQPGPTPFEIQARVFYMFNGVMFKEDISALDYPLNKVISFTANYYVGATRVGLSTSSLEIEPLEKTEIIVEIDTDDFEDDIELKQYSKVGSENEGLEDSFVIKEKNRLYNISVNAGINQISEIMQFEGSVLKAQLKITQITTQTIDFYIDLQTLTLSLTTNNFKSDLWLSMNDYFVINQNTSYNYAFEAVIINQDNSQTPISLTSIFKLNKIQKVMMLEFNPEKIDINAEYVGNYIVEFLVSSNNQIDANTVSSSLNLKINPQSIGVITVSSFEGSQNEDIATGKPENNYVDPMARNKNHFRLSLYPLQADYDYIRIDAGTNPNTNNQLNTIFTLLNTEGTSKPGARNVSNGLIIDKSLINQDIDGGNIYIRYSIEMLNLFNDDNLTFTVRAYKNNQVIYPITKTLTVKFKQDVSIDIIGKTEQDGNIYVTRGSTYNFNLTANGYRDSEVVIEAVTPNIVSASVSSRTLSITSNISVYPIENLKVNLLVYGRKVVNGEIVESSPQVLSLVILDYLILHDNEYVPVNRASNKIASVSIGDTFTLEAKFVLGQTIEYQPSILSIANTVQEFEQAITKQGTWQYQVGTLSTEGNYVYTPDNVSEGWSNLTQDVGLAQTNGYFTVALNKDGKLVITPHKVLDINNPPYKLRFIYGYDYISGKAEYKENVNTTFNVFTLNVYQMSAIDSPTPIYTVAQLQAMNQGSYYILMNDIVIPSNFEPISTQIGGLDGNNKKIIINSNLSFEVSREFLGLFTTISENALIRNLNIEVTSNFVATASKTSTQGVYFGLLTGQNNGMISNVNVRTLPNATIRVAFLEPQNSAINHVSALVGYNVGSITHSRVQANIYASSSLSGFVGYNRGKIANSYVDDSLIVNTSARLESKTAGFVITNAGQDGDGGQIISSYVSGATTNFAIFANSENRVIQSSREVGGFVYENNGAISNSYSNIPIMASTNSAGFVFTNYGKIENSYSTSLLKETSEGTYGFIKSNFGTLKNNYYLEDDGINDTINSSNRYIEGSLTNAYQKGELLQLSISQFGNKDNFASYLFTPTNSITKGVWFYPTVQIETMFNNSLKRFAPGRPELVASNIIAISELEIDFDRTVENTQTGEVDYAYKNAGEFYQGSIYNPIIISSAQEFETKIMQTSSGTINTESFRIVGDLDYGQNATSSNLYRLIFAGDIEGNGMEISNYVVNISNTMASAGLFSKIGVGTSGQGTVKNIVLKPSYINLPNTNSVGALAGSVESATLFNIFVDGSSSTTNTSVMIIGKNLVGGLFGRATGRYSVHNIQSNISVTATYRSAISLNPQTQGLTEKIGSYFLFRSHTTDILSRLSYSGSVAGVLSGEGQVNYIYVNNGVVSNSEWASLVFGGVGNGVVLKNIDVEVNNNQIVQASAYGAAVAAEFYGRMENVKVVTQGETASLFKTEIYKPYGLGAVVGLLGTGENLGIARNVNNYGESGLFNVRADLDIENAEIEVVGGIVGQMISGKIQDAVFRGKIVSKITAGGIVGKVSPTPNAPILLFTQTLLVDETAPILLNLEVLSKSNQDSDMIRVENDNIGIANVGGIVGHFEMFDEVTQSQSKDENNIDLTDEGNPVLKPIIIQNAVVNLQLRAISTIYGGDYAGVYAGGIIGNISELKLNISLENVSFNSRIVINLRHLNYRDPDYMFERNEVGYGFIVGKTVISEELSVAVTGQNATYSTPSSRIVYTGDVRNNDHYLLFRYTEKGVTNSYDDSENENILFIRQRVLNELD